MDKNDLVKFRSECLSAHNFYRSLHATTPLIWSNKLADGAQRWAEELASADSLSYSHERGVGENIACLWGSDVTGNKITQIWYEEAQHFDYSAPRVTPLTRPFCQVIWEGTRELGAGKSTTKNGKHIVVARYNPPATRRNADKNVKRARLDRVDGESSLLHGQSLGVRKFQEECLFAHNELRVLHGSPPLHWSPSLAWAAQQWAVELVRMGELKHNDDEMVGENLAGMVGDELTGKECTDMWYDEVADYDYDNPGYSEDTSNFTQVVWMGSELFGVGRATYRDLCVVVAFYEPPGNMEGLFGDNVRKAGSKVKTYRLIKETKTFIPPSPDLDWFRVECLVAHNYFRARHAATPLVLTHTLNEEAQYWAERLLVTGATEDLQDSRIGINVAVIEGRQHVSGLKVVELWYQESTGYDFNSPGFNLSTRSFTQLLWLTSRKLGVGKAANDTGQCIVVARYEPVGNIDGLFVSNVRRRGHERNALEPMQFESDVKYRIKLEGRRSLRMSWEVEGAMLQADNKNHENARLVWIESPVLPRRRMRPESSDLEKDDKSDEDKESGVDEGEEFDNEEPLFTVVHDTEEEKVEPYFEHAFVYTEPTRTAHYPDVRRSLSLDSQGTEPEPEDGRVLSRVSYFEQLEKMEDSSKRDSRELTPETKKTDEHEETVCQLEFDDVFPKHDENDEREDDFPSDEEVDDDDDDDDGMSLETVSEADEDLMADLDEFEMDHHIKSYCYEESFAREQDDATDDKAELEDHEQIETREESSSSPDHCVAVSVKREDAAEEELKRVDHVFEFVRRDHEKEPKNVDFNKIDLSETEDEHELFKFETQSEKTMKHEGPPCTEVVEEANRNKLEQPLDLEEAFSRPEESEKPKAQPPPTLPKPQRPKQQTKTETVEINNVIITEHTTDIVPNIKEAHSTVIKYKEVCEDVITSETTNESVPLHLHEEHNVIERREVRKATPRSEQVKYSVTEDILPVHDESSLKGSVEKASSCEEQDQKSMEEEKEKKDSILEQPKEIYEETEIRDVEEDEEVISDEEALEVIDISHIDRDRRVHKILNRLGRQIELIPIEIPPKKGEISKDIDLSETDEEKVLFNLFTPSQKRQTWSSSTVDEEMITPVEKERVECALDFDEMFKDEDVVHENEPKEETPREKRRSVSFKETVIIQDYESVREEPLQQEDDQYEYCEEESEEDLENFGDEYDDEVANKSERLQQITFGQPVFLSHEVEETTEIVSDERDVQEENVETFEDEDTSMVEAAVEDSPHPIHLSEELSKDNEFDTCDVNDQDPVGSVADVYEEYEKSYASPVDEGTYVTPVHVAAEVQSHESLETVPAKEESVRSTIYDSFEEVQPEAHSSQVVVPSSCHITAEMEVPHSEVQPVEEAEVDILLSEEEPEETIESVAVQSVPESTESTVCIATETTYHQKTEVIHKRAPSIEVDTYNEDEQIPTEEANFQEILPNGHCTPTYISLDTDAKKHEVMTQSEKETYVEETPEYLEDPKVEIQEVPCIDGAQFVDETKEVEDEKEMEEDKELFSEDEMLESHSTEEVYLQHVEERNEEVLEDTVEHEQEKTSATSPKSLSPVLIANEDVASPEEEEDVEEKPESVEYENIPGDTDEEEESIPVRAASPPKSPSPILIASEDVASPEEEEGVEEKPESVEYENVPGDTDEEEESIPVTAASPPTSPSPMLIASEDVASPEEEEGVEEKPESVEYENVPGDTDEEEESIPVTAASPPKSPSPILIASEDVASPEEEEGVEEKPESVEYENVPGDTDEEEKSIPVRAASPPKSPSPILIASEDVASPEEEKDVEEQTESVEYENVPGDTDEEEESIPVTAASPPKSPSPILIASEDVASPEEEEGVEEKTESVEYANVPGDTDEEEKSIPVRAASPPKSPSPILIASEDVASPEEEEDVEEKTESIEYENVPGDTDEEEESIPVTAASPPKSPSPVLIGDEKVVSPEKEESVEDPVEEQPERVEYESVPVDSEEEKEIPVVVSSSPKSASPCLITDEKVESAKEETTEEDPEIVDYEHAIEDDVHSEDEQIPVVASSPPKSPSPVLITDENVESTEEETAEEEAEAVEYEHAIEDDVHSEDEQIPVVASSPPKSASPVLITDENVESTEEETAEEEAEAVEYEHAIEDDVHSEDEQIPVVASSPPKSPSTALITDENVESIEEETAEEESVEYEHAHEDEAHSEDERTPVVATSSPKSQTPVLVTDEKDELATKQIAEENPEGVEYDQAYDDEAHREDMEVPPVVAFSHPNVASAVHVSDETTESTDKREVEAHEDEEEAVVEEEPNVAAEEVMETEQCCYEEEPHAEDTEETEELDVPKFDDVSKEEDKQEQDVGIKHKNDVSDFQTEQVNEESEETPQIESIDDVVEDEEKKDETEGYVIKQQNEFTDDDKEEKTEEETEDAVEDAEKPVEIAPLEKRQEEEQESIEVEQDVAEHEPKTIYKREEETFELEDGGHVSKVITQEETVQEGNEDDLVVKKTITKRIVTTTTSTSSQFISDEPSSETEIDHVVNVPDEIQQAENQETESIPEVLEELEKEEEKETEETFEKEEQQNEQTQDEIVADKQEEQQAESDGKSADEIVESQLEKQDEEEEENKSDIGVEEKQQEQHPKEAEPEKTTTIETETIELEDGGHVFKTVTREEFAAVKDDDDHDDDSTVSKTITRRIVTTATTTSRTQYTENEPIIITGYDQVEESRKNVDVEIEQVPEHEAELVIKTEEELDEDRERISETAEEDHEEEKHTVEHMLVTVQQASEAESIPEQTELKAQELVEGVDFERVKDDDDLLLQPKPSDDHFGYISEEELEETEELYIALRESFEKQEYEEKVDVDNVCIEETAAVVAKEKFEPSEDDIAYDSEVITEVEKEITSALVVKESFSSTVFDDEHDKEPEQAEAEQDKESNESLVQFDESDEVEECPDQMQEESPDVIDESEEVESADETEKVQLIEFSEDTEKEQDHEYVHEEVSEEEENLEVDEGEEELEEEEEELDYEFQEPEVEEGLEDDEEQEEEETSEDITDEKVKLIQFSEKDEEKVEDFIEEPYERPPSPAPSSPDDEEKDLDSLEEKDLDSSEENVEKSVELIQFSEQEESAEENTSVPYVNIDEEEGEEEKEPESSEELVEESVELIQFSETSEEDKILEFDENSKDEVQYVEEKSEEEKSPQLVQFSKHDREEKTDTITAIYNVEQTERVESSLPFEVGLKSEDEIPKEETLTNYSDKQAQIEEEITQKKRSVPPCIPILLTESEKQEQEEEVELYMLKDGKEVDFINISGEPLACSTPIHTADDKSFDDSSENVFGENYEAIEKIIAHNESDELQHSSEDSHDDSYRHIEADELATKAETEDLDDSLQSPRKEVVEEYLTETMQSKVESIDLSTLEDQDKEVSSSHEDHISPPPTIFATEFVADEEEEGSDEEYIPHFEHPRTYMVETKELLMDSATTDAVDSSHKTDFTDDAEDPSEISATSELSEAIQQEPDMMSFHSTDVHSKPKDELEEEDQELIQRKHEKMEEVFLQEEMEAEISEKEAQEETVFEETRHDESTTLVTYTTTKMSTVTVKSDEQDENTREEVATMIMVADEQKLEETEPKPEHVEDDEAITEDDFRSDGTPSKSDESFDDLEKTRDEEDTLSEIYQEELEVSKLEPAYEEKPAKSQESAPIALDIAFTEEVEIERVPDVEEAPESFEPREVKSEEVDDVYQEEVEIQRVDDYRDNDVFEEEVEIRRVEEQHEEETNQVHEETTAIYEEEFEIKAEERPEAETSEDDSAGILLAEPISSDAEKDDEHNSEEEILQAEPVKEETHESDSPESDQQQELEEYEVEEQDHVIPHEMQGTDEQEHIYDSNNNQSMTRYYVDFSPSGSVDRDSTASEGEYPEVYRQGEPMEEDMEEFILVKYGNQHDHSDSSDEEDLSEHREMYVIPEEDSEDRAHHTDDEEEKNDNFEEHQQEPDEKVFYEQGFMNPALEDINEDEEECEDDKKKDSPKGFEDDEEKRQLEEYERLESFVMLEEKLSQVESGESLEDLTSGTDNKRASSDETLNDDDELADTMNTSSTLKESTSKEGSGEESNNELEKTLTTEEEEVVDLEDGGVLSKRTVREESYSVEEDAGSDADDDDDKDKTLTRKRVARKVITTTTTSETHVTKTPSEDQPNSSDDENVVIAKETVIIEDVPSDEESPRQPKPENTSTFETEQETIDLDDGGTVSKVVTREETCSFDGDGDGSSVVNKTMTRKIVTTTTTRTSRTTPLGDQPLYLTEGDENANKVEDSSSSETRETVIKSRQHGEDPESIDHPAKRQLSREGSGSFPDLCAEPLRKRLAQRFGSRDSLEGHSSEFSADSNGESTSKSSDDLISDDDYPGLGEFQRDCIRQHNIYRHQHRACRLVWSEDLAKAAAAWADHLASTNTLEHSTDKEHGENLASAKGYELRGDKVAEMWYDEVKEYNFEIPAFNAKCGHFTQMIWKDTKEFGVAKGVAADGSQYVVARYYPPGNVLGEFKNCIRRARGQRSSVRKRRRSSTRRRISQTDGVDPVSQQEKFKNECVVSHNYYRSLHGAQPLQWSTRLAIESQNFAEKLARSGSFMHSGDKNIGECLAFSFGLELSGRDAVDSWYDEIVDYDYEFPGFTSHTANFTQIVWQESREFGMGKAIGEDGSCVVVGRYYPPGNQVGCFQDNVKPKQTGYF